MAKKLDDLAGKGVLSPETFLECYKDIRVATRKKDSAVAELRLTKKRAKDRGVDLDALSLMEKLSSMEPEDAAARMQNLIRYRAWDGGGEQISLFPEDDVVERPKAKAAEVHALGKAWETGWDHAKAGGALEDCTFANGTELNQSWVAGFRDAEAGSDPLMASTTPKKASTRRGMPKGPEAVAPASDAPAPLH